MENFVCCRFLCAAAAAPWSCCQHHWCCQHQPTGHFLQVLTPAGWLSNIEGSNNNVKIFSVWQGPAARFNFSDFSGMTDNGNRAPRRVSKAGEARFPDSTLAGVGTGLRRRMPRASRTAWRWNQRNSWWRIRKTTPSRSFPRGRCA